MFLQEMAIKAESTQINLSEKIPIVTLKTFVSNAISIIRNSFKVNETLICGNGVSIKTIGKANSVIKKIIGGYVITERYYNNKGEAYLDIDYTCHGNVSTHPVVPHIHRWSKNERGELIRGKWENFE